MDNKGKKYKAVKIRRQIFFAAEPPEKKICETWKIISEKPVLMKLSINTQKHCTTWCGAEI